MDEKEKLGRKRFMVDGHEIYPSLVEHLRKEKFIKVVFSMIGRPIWVAFVRNGWFVDFVALTFGYDPEYLDVEVYSSVGQPLRSLLELEVFLEKEAK